MCWQIETARNFCVVLQLCKFVKTQPKGRKMVCRMPVVNVPNDLIQDLKKSQSGRIDSTQGPGVASYVASNADARADVYVGFDMNGFQLYQNVSAIHHPDLNIRMQFALNPVITCPSELIEENDLIFIQVTTGLTLVIRPPPLINIGGGMVFDSAVVGLKVWTQKVAFSDIQL